jgi:antitoxin (DNA-binding transcriptional repressor) of toxin-antitoxin stability system
MFLYDIYRYAILMSRKEFNPEAISNRKNASLAFNKFLIISNDRLEFGGEEIILVRNNHTIARIIPGSPHLKAAEAMADSYRTLTPEAAKDLLEESRLEGKLAAEMRSPWVSC